MSRKEGYVHMITHDSAREALQWIYVRLSYLGEVWPLLAVWSGAAVLRGSGRPDAVRVCAARVDHPRIQDLQRGYNVSVPHRWVLMRSRVFLLIHLPRLLSTLEASGSSNEYFTDSRDVFIAVSYICQISFRYLHVVTERFSFNYLCTA